MPALIRLKNFARSAVWQGAVVLLLLGGGGARAGTNLSVWAFPGASGRTLLVPDAWGNRLMDHSGVGYQGGTVPLPEVTVKTNVAPGAGDDTARIQGAINYVKTLPLDASGFRGAVLLSAGEYQLSNSLTIDVSGIVLRGAGDGSDTNLNTILRATYIGSNQPTLVVISGAGARSLGTARNITNSYVPTGARSFNVSSTAGLTVGGRVIVMRPFTTNWISVLGMDQLQFPWTTNNNLPWDRTITRLEGSRITLDAPISTAIESQYGGATIQPYTWSGRITNVGVELIRGVSDFDPGVTNNTGASSYYYSDENHAWSFIGIASTENAWVRNVTSQHFGFACVKATASARNVTVRDCVSLDPVSIITGSRRYAFTLDDAQFCLVQNCTTENDRHQFVTQSLTCGPNVFVDGTSTNAYSDAGPHFLWGNGALWDNITVNGDNIDVQNRGNAGTQHGWAGANEIIWNSKAAGFIVQNPPTARNWLIGSVGPIQNGTMYVGPHDPGTYDSHGTNVFPNSLYYAQLQDRLAAPRVETREYWLGEINQFSNSSPTGTVVTVDAAWRTAIQGVAAGAPLNGFDLVTNNQFVPFTFNYSISATDRVVGASLALALRAAAASTNEALYLETAGSPRSFASLGWLPIGTGTNTTVRVLDLGDQLAQLADGQLNVAVSDDVGVDWALLELHVAPVQTLYTNIIYPGADATVRGGTSAAVNYGSGATLEVKLDSAADQQRQAYLRWNLAGTSGRVQHARLRLTPVSVDTNGLEHAVALATTNDWLESAVTWANQPGAGKRFATRIAATNTPVEFVVTPQVQAALAGDGRLSLQIASLKNVSGLGLVSYASREDADPARRPQLLLMFSNAVPNVSAIGDQFLPVNSATGPLTFTISDPVYPADQLAVGVASANPGLVPPENLVLGGSVSNRTLTLTPVLGQTGSTLISLTVTNPLGQTAGTQFTLYVTNNTVGSVPVSGSWAVDSSGVWINSLNWTGGIIATGASMTATFGVNLTANRFINNETPRVLGALVFTNASLAAGGAWFITNQPLTLQVGSGTPGITVSNVEATVQSALLGTQGLNKQGDGTLILAGTNAYSGVTTINAGAVRVAANSALGSAAAGTSIPNPETARLELIGDVTVAEPLTVSCKGLAFGNAPAVKNVSGTNTLSGQINLIAGGSFWTLEAAAGKLRVTGFTTNSTTANVRTLWLRGAGAGEWNSAIGDSAGGLATAIRKDDSGVWELSGNNSATGTITVSNGTLMVSGTVRGAVNVFGGTLGGSGVIGAPVSIEAGATLAPGADVGSLGTLTISRQLTLAADSATRMELNALNLTCDRVAGLSNVVYGGTLVLSNLAGTLLAGQSFQLFQATNASGGFAGFSPVSPGPGLAWDFNSTNGSLSMVSAVAPQFTSITAAVGGSFNLSGTGPAGAGYRIFGTTNLALPFGNWVMVTTGIFSGGVFNSTDTQANLFPQRFYQVVTP